MFSWAPPSEELSNGVITGYRISCAANGNRMGNPITETVGLNVEMATVQGLTPATRYNCSLAARTSAGFGVNGTRVVLTSMTLYSHNLCIHIHTVVASPTTPPPPRGWGEVGMGVGKGLPKN
jgi:hypothetical protein